MELGELLLKGKEAQDELDKIRRIHDHLELEIDKAYNHELAVKEYGADGDPYEPMDNLIAILEKALSDCKKLRGHTHDWFDYYQDGRDLSCRCRICGCYET
jgi:hypothetical protein